MTMKSNWDEEDFEVEDDFDEDDFKIRFVTRQEVIDSLLDRILEEGKTTEDVRTLLTDLSSCSC